MNISILCIDEGHTKSGSDYGAEGNGLKESVESRVLGAKIVTYMNKLGKKVDKCTVDYANSVDDSIIKRKNIANQRPHDLLIIIHFNSYGDPTAHGCEVFILPNHQNYYSSTASFNKNLAYGEAVLEAVCKAGGFYKREGKVKYRDNLGMLTNTNDYAVYLEVCFISNKSDADKYKANKDNIAKAIVEAITGNKLPSDNNNNSNNNIVEKVGFDMKNLVCFGNGIDKRIVPYLTDALGCSEFDANIPSTEYKNVENVIAVGGEPAKFGKFSGHTKYHIKASDRFDTGILALQLAKRISKGEAVEVVLAPYKVK